MSAQCVGRLRGGLLTVAVLSFAIAARADGVNSAWYMRSWQSADGLPDNAVSGVAQTPDGFLWIATAGGLMRFDGVRFQEFPLASLPGVPNRVVRDMLLDRAGRLWLDMDRGPVVCIGPGSTRVFTNQLPDMKAAYMAEDARGAVWIAYAGGRLVRIEAGRVTTFGPAEGWLGGSVSSVASDAAGRLWFSSGNRVGVFENGTFRVLLTLPETVWCVGRRREGGIWICAGRRLLSCSGAAARPFGELPAERNGFQATALLEDRAGALWVGTAANGLFRCDGTNVAQVPTSYRDIACLTQDREGNIWAGTAGGGLDRLRPRIIELLGPASGLPYESVRSVCQDRAGAVWVVAQNGELGKLLRWQNHSWGALPAGTNAPSGNFFCVAADPRGGLWIGTRDRGLYHLRDGRCRNWRRADGLASDTVRCILETSAGVVYAATDEPNRLQRLENGRWRQLTTPVQTHTLRALAEDAAGRVWAGSADGYLFRVEGDRLVNETPEAPNRLLSIRCLCATADGSLWIGYAGWGIGWLKDGRYARITPDQGLYDDYVSQLMPDQRGWLWCAGNRGIFEVQLDQLLQVAQGRQNQVRCIAYSRGEGFPNLQPNYENTPGALRSADGRIWFPMRTGLALIHPERVPAKLRPPPVLIEQVAVDGRTIGLDEQYMPSNPANAPRPANLQAAGVVLRLPPSPPKLDVEFTALSFTAPENVGFQYRLQGLDDHWNEAGGARSVSYSRLPPGNYRFQVRACNFAGVWNRQGAFLDFVVLPFYWQTWWFRLGALAAFTLSVVATVRYVSFRRLHRRLRVLEQQAAVQRERARIAKDIHDDLGANLTQIAYLGELAQQDQACPSKATERILKISETARQAVKSLDEIVWAVNPRNDTPAHLVDYAGQFAIDYLRLAGVRCRLDFPPQSPARELSTDLRHNLFLVIKEALHNIVKHAHATEVWLRAAFSERALELTVEDNGCGFEQAPNDAFADGLRNMRQRMGEIGGECRFESQPGRGTRVTLHLPWPADHET